VLRCEHMTSVFEAGVLDSRKSICSFIWLVIFGSSLCLGWLDNFPYVVMIFSWKMFMSARAGEVLRKISVCGTNKLWNDITQRSIHSFRRVGRLGKWMRSWRTGQFLWWVMLVDQDKWLCEGLREEVGWWC